MTQVPIGEPAQGSEEHMMSNEDLRHMAFVLVHGGFEEGNGGCSCATCSAIRSLMYVIRQTEAEEFTQTTYGLQAGGGRVGP